MGKPKDSDKPASTVGDETQTQTKTDAPAPTEPTPAPKSQKPKAGKVEVSPDATPDETSEADQRLADARQQALNNHSKATA